MNLTLWVCAMTADCPCCLSVTVFVLALLLTLCRCTRFCTALQASASIHSCLSYNHLSNQSESLQLLRPGSSFDYIAAYHLSRKQTQTDTFF